LPQIELFFSKGKNIQKTKTTKLLVQLASGWLHGKTKRLIFYLGKA